MGLHVGEKVHIEHIDVMPHPLTGNQFHLLDHHKGQAALRQSNVNITVQRFLNLR